MKSIFLVIVTLILVCLGLFGFRGRQSIKPAYHIFPDMDVQDRLDAQSPSNFFADKRGARKLVNLTVPVENRGGQEGDDYYQTGHIGDYYGNGMPKSLLLTKENVGGLLVRGKERYQIYCATCHGFDGLGEGVVTEFGLAGVKNLHQLTKVSFPDGRIFEVITHGVGNMKGYAYNIPVRDRWAIVAYIRALQAFADEEAKKRSN